MSMSFDFASFLRGGARPVPTSPANGSVENTISRSTSQPDAPVLLAPQSLASADALAAAVAAGDAGAPQITAPKGRALQPGQDVYNTEFRQPGEEQPQLKVSPITMLKTDFRLEMLSQIAVNSTYICYALKAGHIRVLNKHTAGRALLKGHSGVITDMKFFAPGSNLVASSSKRGDIIVRTILEAGEIEEKVLLKFPGASPPQFNTKLAWHPSDPNSLAYISGGRLCFLHVPDPESVTEAAELTDPALQLFHQPGEDFTSVAFSPSGECIAVSSQQGTCYTWWLLGPPGAVGEPNVAFEPHGGQPVSTVEFLSNTSVSARVLTGNATNSEIKLWQLVVPGKKQCLYTLNFEAASPGSFYNHIVLQPALNLVILANSQQTQVFAVHYTDSHEVLRFNYIAEFSHMHRILSLTSEVDPNMEECHLYCVQTEAIQRYTLDKATCVPLPEDLAAQLELVATPGRQAGTLSHDTLEPPTSGTIPPTFITRSSDLTHSTGAHGTSSSIGTEKAYGGEGLIPSPAVPDIPTSINPLFPAPASESALASVPALLGPVEPITAAPPAIPAGGHSAYPPLQAFATSVSSSSSFNSLPANAAGMSRGSQGSALPAASHSNPASPKDTIAHAFSNVTTPVQPSPLYTTGSDAGATPGAASITAQPPSAQLFTPSSSTLTSPAISSSHVDTTVSSLSPFPGNGPPFSSAQPQLPSSMHLITPDTFKTMPSVARDSSLSSIPSMDTAGGALLQALLQRDLSAIGGAAAAAAAPPLPEGASLPFVPTAAAGPVPAVIAAAPAPTITADAHSVESDPAPAVPAVPPTAHTSVPHLVGPLELMQELSADGVEPETSAPASASASGSRSAHASGTILVEPFVQQQQKQPESSRTVVDNDALLALQQTILDTLASNHKEVMKGLGRLSGIGEVQKQLGKLESGLNRTLEQQLAKVTQRKAEEDRRRNTALESSLEKILPTLAATISKDVATTVREATAQQSAALLASITPALEKSVAVALQASLGAELAGPVLQGTLQNAVGTQLKVTLFDTLRRNFEVQVIPAFEKATQAMFSQIEGHLKWGLAEHLKLASSTSPEVVAALRESTSQVQALTAQLTSMKQELSELQGQLATMTQTSAQATTTASSTTQAAAVGRPMTLSQIEEQHDPKTYITNMLKSEKYEEAFSKALSLSNLETLMWTIRQLSVKMLADDPCPLSQPVLLSLVQQLAFDLQDETETKLEWILEAAHNLQAAEKYRGYMQQVLSNLNGLLTREPQGDVARKTKLCILLLKNLLV